MIFLALERHQELDFSSSGGRRQLMIFSAVFNTLSVSDGTASISHRNAVYQHPCDGVTVE